MIRDGKLPVKNVECYKEEHPISASDVYVELYEDRTQYLPVMKLFKLSLLITPSTANVERGFSTLNLLHTKQRNSLSVQSLDYLMRLVLLGEEKYDDEKWEVIVDRYRDSAERRIDL